MLGQPRLHLRRTGSTNDRARELALSGAPHGTVVTAGEQTAGRGRQGRVWVAPPDSALLASVVLRDPPPLLSLRAGVAACEAIYAATSATEGTDGPKPAHLKWPNDIVVGPELAKLGGILVEGRPQERWAVMGIGLNVAVSVEHLPTELRETAATLGLHPSDIDPLLMRLLEALERRLGQTTTDALHDWSQLDVLRGREVSWAQSRGTARGIDEHGRLVVELPGGEATALTAGEVHLER